MYQVLLGILPLPVAPSRITTTVGNRSKTIELINGDEVNIPKGGRLTKIAFDFMLPSQDYPFTTFTGSLVGGLLQNFTGAVTTTVALKLLEVLKSEKEPFYFICARLREGINVSGIYNTIIKVTLEEYTVIEDANNGHDYIVSVELKEFKEYNSEKYNSNGTIEKERPK